MKVRIPLSRPDLGESELRELAGVLESGILSRGQRVDRFEQQLAREIGRAHVVGLSSGTAALHLSLLALGVGAGDEVITTAFSVPASINPIFAVSATPVLVDIDDGTRALCPEQVRQAITPRTRAILAVHPFGQPADIERLAEIASDHGLWLIEDACEALGTRLESGALGSFGDVSVFGFYPNKQLTTGEGGVALTDREDLADAIRLLANHGRSMDGSWLDQQRIGFNYRLSELHAAVGVAQLDRLEELLARRQNVADGYRNRLDGSGWILPAVPPRVTRMGWFAWVIQLPPWAGMAERDQLVEDAADAGIQLGRYFAPLHRQPAIRAALGDVGPLPITDAVAERSLALPFHGRLTPSDIDDVCQVLLDGLGALGSSQKARISP